MCNPLFTNFDGRKMVAHVGHWRPLAKGIIPSPIANSLDLSSANLCPNACYFCNVKRTQVDGGNMTDETFAHLLGVYRRHQVKSCCIAGGGESLVNPRCEDYFREIVDTGTEIGIITNGRIYREIPPECKFINVSINAADDVTYARMSGCHPESFVEVCSHIMEWVAQGHYVTYKVMMTDKNKSPQLLQEAVDLAARLGCKAVLFRFAMLPWDMVGGEEYVTLTDQEADLYEAHLQVLRRHNPQLDIRMPLERYDRCSRKHAPKRCTGGAVNFVTLWNGDVVLCSDHRTNPKPLP